LWKGENRNPKHEIETISNDQLNTKTMASAAFLFEHWSIRILNLFRFSSDIGVWLRPSVGRIKDHCFPLLYILKAIMWKGAISGSQAITEEEQRGGDDHGSLSDLAME
jgi:hypothetical protein